MRREWLVPLTGVAFIVVAIIGFIVGGEPPDVDSPVQEIVDHYVDNKDSMQIGSALVVIGVAFFLFFAGYLRKVLRAAEGENGMLSAMVLAGATVMAVGAAIDATISFALADAADKIEPDRRAGAAGAVGQRLSSRSPSDPACSCLPAASRSR